MNAVVFMLLFSSLATLFSFFILIKEWKKSIWMNYSFLFLLLLMTLFIISNILEWLGETDILDPFESLLLPMAWSFFIFTNIINIKILDLNKSEEKLKIILSSIGDAVITTNTEGKVEWINEIAENLTGWSSVQARGRNLADIFKIIKASDHKKISNPVNAVLASRKIAELAPDTILVDHSGAEHHISDSAAPIKDERGNIHGVVIAFTDVTANYSLQQQLLENKERLELAILGGQLGTWDWDINHGTVIYNNIWASMLGYSIDEMDHRFSFWKKLIHPGDLERVMRCLDDHLYGSTQFFACEYRLKAKSGDWVWVLAKGKVIMKDMDGQPVRACGTHLDITRMKKDRQQMEDQKERLSTMNDRLLTANRNLDDANTRLKELDLLKNDFLSMASHELRTPVTSVLGFAQTLLTPGLIRNEAKRSEYLKIIEQEAIRLGKLIDDLLNISAIETEHDILNMKCCPLDDIAREVIDSMHPLPGQTIIFVDSQEKRKNIYCNRDKISQVFFIVIDNALRYGNEIIIKIDEENSSYLVSIHDNGPGIAIHHLKVIFEKFYRIQGDLKPGKGSGLGLAIAKEIITIHGGNIWAESAPGRGSTFYFTLKKC